MKFTCETTIARARDDVAALWADDNRLAEWQPGFVHLQHLDGEPGQPGARSRIRLETTAGRWS